MRKFVAAAVAAIVFATGFLPALQVQGEEAGQQITVKAKQIDSDEEMRGGLLKELGLGTKEQEGEPKGEPAIQGEDMVTLIVELEQRPLLEQQAMGYRSAGSAEDRILAEHNTVKAGVQSAIMGRSRAAVSFGYDYTTIINAFTVETQYKNLEKIQRVEGVKRVFPASSQQIVFPEETTGTGMTGAAQTWEKCGYNGEGMKIAVVDSALDMEHEVFQTAPKDPAYSRGDIEKLFSEKSLHAKSFQPSKGAEVYHSEKIPFQFDYADRDTDVSPNLAMNTGAEEHGTHVSGIATGYLPDPGNDAAPKFSGTAPQAQLFFMKVCRDGDGNIYDDVMLAAIEDAILLGADVINTSLGSPAGNSSDRNEAFQEIYERISAAGVHYLSAAGNSYTSAYGNAYGGKSLSKDPDTSIISSPSSYSSAMSVASALNNRTVLGKMTSDGREIFYKDAYSFRQQLLGTEASKTYEYVFVPGAGEEKDYQGLDVNGKLVLIKDGDGIDYYGIMANARSAGSAGVIIYNAKDDSFKNILATVFPMCYIGKQDGEFLEQSGSITLVQETTEGEMPDGGTMSAFSSIGPTPDLYLKPDITAPGGEIFSSVPSQSHNGYAHYNGTSMATPQMSGAAALVRQYVKKQFPNLSEEKAYVMVNQLLMSTAEPILQPQDNELQKIAPGPMTYYSPRKQGAGMVNIYRAVSAPAYLAPLKADESNNSLPKLSLGDDPEKRGIYELSFLVKNPSGKELTYNIETAVLTTLYNEGFALDGYSTELYQDTYTPGEGRPAKLATVTGDKSVAFQQGETEKTVQVTVTLENDAKEYLNQFENGTYVEGYVRLLPAGAGNEIPALSIPYLAFYGDWTDAPILDHAAWYETEKKASNFAHEVYVNDFSASFPLGMNNEGDASYTAPDAFAISPNGDGISDYISEVHLGLLRNADYVRYQVQDSEGKEVYSFESKLNPKTFYHPNTGSMYPATYDNTYQPPVFKAQDKDGKVLPDGKYIYRAQAGLTYKGRESDNPGNVFEFPFVIDTKIPVLADGQVTISEENEKTWLRGKISDNHALGYLRIVSIEREETLYVKRYDASVKNTEMDALELDITGLEGSISLQIMDYAGNITAYAIPLLKPGTAGSLNTDRMVVGVGRTGVLSLLAADGTTMPAAWNSSKPEVAEVDNNGTVTGKTAGQAVITAQTEDGASYSCLVGVMESEKMTELHLNIKELTMPMNTIAELEILGNLPRGSGIWSTSNQYAAPVVGGLVLASAPGDAKITVELDGMKDTCKIHVVAENGYITSDMWEYIGKGIVNTTTYEGIESDLFVMDPDAVDTWSWESSNPEAVLLAPLDEQKSVAGGAEGASMDGIQQDAEGAGIEGVQQNAEGAGIEGVQQEAEGANIEGINIEDIEQEEYRVSTEDMRQRAAQKAAGEKVAMLGMAGGSSTVTAVNRDSAGNKIEYQILVTVEAWEKNRISLSPKSIDARVGETVHIEAICKPLNAREVPVEWISFDSTLASVGNSNALGADIQCLAEGSVLIGAELPNKTMGTVVLNITLPDPDSVTLDKSEAVLKTGDTLALKASIAPENAKDKTVTWSTSDTEVAAVDQKGLVTAKKAGTVVIRAESVNGKYAECRITVEDEKTPGGTDQPTVPGKPGETEKPAVPEQPDGTNKPTTPNQSLKPDASGEKGAQTANVQSVAAKNIQSGDRASIEGWLAAGILAAICAGGAAIYRKRKGF